MIFFQGIHSLKTQYLTGEVLLTISSVTYICNLLHLHTNRSTYKKSECCEHYYFLLTVLGLKQCKIKANIDADPVSSYISLNFKRHTVLLPNIQHISVQVPLECEYIFLIGEGKPSLQMVGHVNPAIHPTCYFSDLLGEVTHSLSIPVCPQSSTVVSSDVLRTAAKCCPWRSSRFNSFNRMVHNSSLCWRKLLPRQTLSGLLI